MKTIDEMEFRRLETSYSNAHYIVFGGEEKIVIRIGEMNPGLDELLNRHEATCWAFISAHNPYSQPLTAEENDARHTELKIRLPRTNFQFIEGYGESVSGDWKAEASFLVLGIERNSAVDLANVFEQNAFVAGELGGKPELVWCVTISGQAAEPL